MVQLTETQTSRGTSESSWQAEDHISATARGREGRLPPAQTERILRAALLWTCSCLSPTLWQ